MYLLFVLLCVIFVESSSIKGPIVHDVYWKFYKGYLPDDAIAAAPGKYIGNILSYGRIPATILHRSGTATTEMKGKQVDIVDNILIMCSANPQKLYWEHLDFNTTFDQQMENAVVGGFYNEILANVYIGKALNGGQWKVGRVIANDHHLKGLWIWDNDRKSVCLDKFHILKYNVSRTVTC